MQVDMNDGKMVKVSPNDPSEKIIWTGALKGCSSCAVFTENAEGARRAILTHFQPILKSVHVSMLGNLIAVGAGQGSVIKKAVLTVPGEYVLDADTGKYKMRAKDIAALDILINVLRSRLGTDVTFTVIPYSEVLSEDNGDQGTVVIYVPPSSGGNMRYQHWSQQVIQIRNTDIAAEITHLDLYKVSSWMPQWSVVFLIDKVPLDSVVLLKRAATKKFAPNFYTGIGGKVEPWESAEAGALRELEEETGIQDVTVTQFGQCVIDDVRSLHYFWRRYLGRPSPACNEGVLEWEIMSNLVNRDINPTTRKVIEEWQKRGFALDQTWTLRAALVGEERGVSLIEIKGVEERF